MVEAKAPVVSLELLLDAESEARIRAEWQALADAGLSSLAAHTSPSNLPHITVLVRSAIPHAVRFAVTLPIPVTVGPLVLFGSGDRRVLARSVVPSLELLHLHATVHRQCGPGEDAPHTRPGEWTPHITLARRLRVDALPQALGLLEAAHPIVGSATSLRRWDSQSATVTELVGSG